jgi:hypothetical protein
MNLKVYRQMLGSKMKAITFLLPSLLVGCSVPGVATITIKNKSNFPIAVEYKMSKSDGNKQGRLVTPPKDDKNHDFTYNHDPLSDDRGKQNLKFSLSGKYFKFKLDQDPRSLTEIRYQGAESDQQVELDPASFHDLKDEELPLAFNAIDHNLLVYATEDGGALIYIAADEAISKLDLGIRFAHEDNNSDWQYHAMIEVKEVFLNSKSGRNILEKTYICNVNHCHVDK